MEEKRTTLPENAQRELKPGEKYEPLLSPQKNYPEVTPYSVCVGLIMVIIFSAAAAYLGLKVGQVFEAAIPIAIIAVGLTSALGKKGGLGQNVIIQSIGGCSGSVVAGAIFTLPAIYIRCRGKLYADVPVLPSRRHSRHPLPDSVQKILRKGDARQVSFP